VLDGIALSSPQDDTVGVAKVVGGEVELAIKSPSSTYGTTLDYPVLTIAGHVPATTPLGASFLFGLDPASSLFQDANGIAYPMEIAPGVLSVEPGISIDDVQPGSADLRAGSVVRVFGTNFTRRTEIRFNEAKIAAQRFVNPQEIDVVLGSPARMHGMQVRAKDSRSETEYFSYQRTTRDGESTDPQLAGLVPVFPHRSATAAAIDLAGDNAGLGLQNLAPESAAIEAELIRADGTVLSSASFTVGSNRYVVRSIPELFQFAYAPGLTVRLSSTTPFQAMGIGVDGGRYAAPIPAR